MAARAQGKRQLCGEGSQRKPVARPVTLPHAALIATMLREFRMPMGNVGRR
jgi:hypothetical protein